MYEVRADWERYLPNGNDYGETNEVRARSTSKTNVIQNPQYQSVHVPAAQNHRQASEGCSWFTEKQIIVGVCLGQVCIGGMAFIFSYYGYLVMNSIKERFDSMDGTKSEAVQKIQLYSAFYNFDELLNCILSVVAVVGGITGLWGSISHPMTSFHAVFGSLISAGCFFGTCTGVFTTVITLINGIPVTAAEAVINNFASSVSFAITGNNRRDEKFPIDAMEALICVIASDVVASICLGVLSVLFLISSSVSFLNRNKLQKQKRILQANILSTSEYYESDPENRIHTA